MVKQLDLQYVKNQLDCAVQLTASKSESNRALIIQALSNQSFSIHNLATAEDTLVLLELLKTIARASSSTLNVGIAGTVMRFLTAYLSITKGEWQLTGEQRMKERPIGILVDALRQIGADINYLEKPGYPPLGIHGKRLNGGKVTLDGSVSSQYITALLLIAPTFKNGLQIQFNDEVISKPYITMTISMMRFFGIDVEWIGSKILVQPGVYRPNDITIESDWSAASYWYGFAALAEQASITLTGLKRSSLQGDAKVAEMYKKFGVTTAYFDGGIKLSKQKAVSLPQSIAMDFTSCPDIAQTVAVTCAALNIEAKLTGLKTLRIKETDRISALQTELNKLGFSVEVKEDDIIVNSQESLTLKSELINTYNDHRMAMAFAPLSLLTEIHIENPEVVRKSYPGFWEDFIK